MLITIPCRRPCAQLRVGVVAAGGGGTSSGLERERPEIRSSKFTTLNVGVTVSATLALFVGLISLYSSNTRMGIDFYYAPGSAPCRTVLLAAKALGIDLNLKFVDLMKGEHLTPEFVKLNPQHTVPTINDNGFSLWESRAIITYLSDQYGKSDSLYPKDPKKRALIDQRLYFDIGTLYARFADYYYPVIFGGASYDPAKLTKCEEAFKFLDSFLEKSEFVAGDKLSLADLSLVSTVTTFEVVDFDLSPYPNVARWLAKVKATTPGYEEANGKNVLIFKQMVDALTKK